VTNIDESMHKIVGLLNPLAGSVKVLKPLVLSVEVLSSRALKHECLTAKLIVRSYQPDAMGTGTIFRIALDNIDEGLALTGADYALMPLCDEGGLGSAKICVVRLSPTLVVQHVWHALDCVTPLLSHLPQPAQATVSKFARVPGETTVWDLTLPAIPLPPPPPP
jgi:hypothetical protein